MTSFEPGRIATRTTTRIMKPTKGHIIAAALTALLVAGCDSGPSVNEQFRAKADPFEQIRGAGGVVPVALDSLPDVLKSDLAEELQSAAADLRDRAEVEFEFTPVPDGRALALRVAFQPPDELTALSLCQGQPIGRTDSKRRSITIVAALCEDRRRLVARAQCLFAERSGGRPPGIPPGFARRRPPCFRPALQRCVSRVSV